jgi:hypothetical protein
MLELSLYDDAFKAKLNEQLAVYVTIGKPNIESPMWFQFVGVENNCLRFQSSQVSYMFFNIPLFEQHLNFELSNYFNSIYDHFKAVKYTHIKENWQSVYYQSRPNEKPISPVIATVLDDNAEIKQIDYHKQATDFLTATNTTFKATYKAHDFYFTDDKQCRDIYSIVLKNDRHRYRFNFGQSIANSSIAPDAYDVLACLTKYDIGTFDNFCADFGYDTDSRKAYKTYKAVLKEWKNVELLFTPDQLEQLQDIN